MACVAIVTSNKGLLLLIIATFILKYRCSYIYQLSALNKMAAGERQPSVEVVEIVSLEKKVAETDVSRGCLDEERVECADVERVLCFSGNDRESGEMACCELYSGWFIFGVCDSRRR